MYDTKCDARKKTIGKTKNLGASARGGRCDDCRSKNTKSNWVTIRMTPAEKAQIEADAKKAGLDSVSAYVLQILRRRDK